MSPKIRRTLSLLLKVGVTLGALAYVLARVDLSAIGRALSEADGFWLFVALLLFNASKIASAFRLNLYFRAIGLRLSQSYNLILYYVGMFYNLFLPGGIGGDGYKIYLLNRHFAHRVKPLFQAVLLDRLSGLAALALYALVLFLLSDYALFFGPAVAILAFVAAFSLFPAAWWATKRFFPDFLPVFKPTMAWGLAVQLLQLLCALAILFAIGVEELIPEYLTLFLLSSVAAVLPLTVGGVGLRELTFLYGLQTIHQPAENGVTFSFLFFAITALSSLAGLFLLGRVVPETKGAQP